MPEEQFQSWNHFVPRLYLKRFQSKPGHLWHYRCLVSHESVSEWREVSIDQVAAHDYLYTYADDDGESDRIERWLCKEFESPAEEALDKAVRGLAMSSKDWRRLARFFAAQIVRTPAYYLKRRDHWVKHLPEAMEGTMQELREKLPQAKDEGVFRTFGPVSGNELFPLRYTIQPGVAEGERQLKIEVTAGRKLWLWEIEKILTNSQSLAAMESHHWTVLTSPEDQPWHTTDDPAIVLGYNGDGSMNFNGGWGAPKSVMLLPISPDHLLYTQVGAVAPQKYSRVSVEKAKEIRRVITNHAFRSYYADSPYPAIARFRPRKVDAEQFQQERKAWMEWRLEQSHAEQFLDESRWGKPGS